MSEFNIEGVRGFIGALEGRQVPSYNLKLTAPSTHTSNHFLNIHTMKAEMPIDILDMFRANDIPPLRAVPRRKCRPLQPVLSRLPCLPFDEGPEEGELLQTVNQKKERLKFSTQIEHEQEIEHKLQEWMPFGEQVQSDPFKTLFVGRLDYRTTERTLRNEFDVYGSIKSVRIVKDRAGKSRGYGFVQFQERRSLVFAYKSANGRKIDSRRILVDIERGRTTPSWRPMRLGKGLGGQSRRDRSRRQRRRSSRSSSR